MDRRLMRMVVVGVVAAVMLQCAAAETVHVVGGSTGWRIPSNALEYSTWASAQTFLVGDILTFTFTTGQHDVQPVSKASYDACSSSNAVGRNTTGPANVTLSSAGDHYYICTFGTHCKSGQKLAITVTTTAPSPSSTTAPPSSTTAPLPPNSSSSAMFDGFFVTMLCVVAMAFFL